MVHRFRVTRHRLALAAILGCATAIGTTSCKRRAGAMHAQKTTSSHPAAQPLEVYQQQDPTWKHKVAILGSDVAAGAGAAAPPASELAKQLEDVGFSVVHLQGPPADGGPYNTIVEVGRLQDHMVVDARVLAPAAEGRYEQQVSEGEQALFARVVTGLAQHLQPAPKPPPPPPVEETAPPPPDPKEVCRAACDDAVESCARTCCEKELGSDPARCDAARDAANRCESQCQEKSQQESDPAARDKRLEECRAACRRGKHGAYTFDTSVARSGAVYAKCGQTCDGEKQTCLAACEEAPADAPPTETPAPGGTATPAPGGAATPPPQP